MILCAHQKCKNWWHKLIHCPSIFTFQYQKIVHILHTKIEIATLQYLHREECLHLHACTKYYDTQNFFYNTTSCLQGSIFITLFYRWCITIDLEKGRANHCIYIHIHIWILKEMWKIPRQINIFRTSLSFPWLDNR